ncbi:MAG: hypothetical protein Q8M98_05060 [Candidatus Cloacimonadaceae bacterium]|nr:hypothetical protein [Candidatus Cloacimonadaceae bacterium]
MRYIAVILILGLLLTMSCGLKRSNPLDPIGNPDIKVPQTVSNVVCTPSPVGASSKFVNITWDLNSPQNTEGYYIYRGLAFYSAYAVVDTVFTNTCTHGSKPWHSVSPGDYYYKVSAFKTYSGDRLEGRSGHPTFVRVPV